ncbi:MAG: tetratricopeptide repeat protein [Anaerolineae bacterium]|nr:tetratricopeptide repeat protein [Anaerolineae bacterium]
MHPSLFRNPAFSNVVLQDELNGLINTNLLQDTRQFLIDHPHLFSKTAVEVLEFWLQQANQHRDERAAEAIAKQKALLEIIWPICVEAPLHISSKHKTYSTLTESLHQNGIQSIDDLSTNVEKKPTLTQELSRIALQDISEVDWAILVLLATNIAGEDILVLINELHLLLDYEVDFNLALLIEWASNTKTTHLLSNLTHSRDFISDIKEKVSAGEIRLHNMPLWRLTGQYINTSSWGEKWQLIKEHHDELLSDAGFEEMNSHLSSIFFSLITDDGNSRILILGWSMMHLEVLERCKQVGVEAASSDKPIVEMPLELWTLSGMLQSVWPRIRSWNGFQEAWQERPEQIEVLATEMGKMMDSHQLSLNDSELPYDEREVLRRLVLIQFAFRHSPEVFLQFFSNEPEFSDDTTANLLQLLLRRYEERDESTTPDVISGLWGLFNSSYCSEILSTVESIYAGNFQELAPTGGHLAVFLGGLALLATCESDMDRLNVARSVPSIVDARFIQLINRILVDGKNQNSELCQALDQSLPFLNRSVEIGPKAAFVEFDGQTREGLSPQVIALASMAAAETPEQMVEILEDSPLPVDEVLIGLSEYILKQLGDSSQEIDPEEVMYSRNVYAQALDIRRERREQQASFQRQIPNLPGSKEAANLILTLETNLLAGLWAPVSRVDLTPTFFTVLESLVEQVQSGLGEWPSKPLHQVETQTRKWLDQFGEVTDEHSLELSQALSDLVLVDEKSEQLRIVQGHPELGSNAALDILRDWLITMQSLSLPQLTNRISSLLQFLERSQAVSPEMAYLQEGIPAERLEVIKKRMAKIIGIEEDCSLSDIFMSVMDLPDNQFIQAQKDMMSEMFDPKTENLDATSNQRRLRIILLKQEFDQAVKDNSVLELLKNEPLLLEPEVVDYVLAEQSPEYKANFQKLIQIFPTSLFQAIITNRVTDEQQAVLDRMDELLNIYYFSSWLERIKLVRNNAELLLPMAWLRAHTIKGRIIEISNRTDVDEEDRKVAHQDLSAAMDFLGSCQEVGIEVAANSKMIELSGQSTDNRFPGSARLLSNLPTDLARQFVLLNQSQPKSVDYIEYYERLLKEMTLDEVDKATVYAMLGMTYGAESETGGQLSDLNKAIEMYQESLRITRPNTLEQAVRLMGLANNLVNRFEFFGNTSQDLDEAILAFRNALCVPLLDNINKGQILGHLGRTLLCSYEAFERLVDLEEAIEVLEEAIRLTPTGTRDWIGWHLNLGGAYGHHSRLFDNSQLFEKVRSFEKARDVYEQALSEAEQEPDLQQLLKHNLITLLRNSRQSLESIDTAIKDIQSIKEDSSGMTKYGFCLTLGNLWVKRFESSLNKTEDDITQAIRVYKEALDSMPQNTPDWFMILGQQANAFQKRAEYFGDPHDFAQAITHYETAINSSLISTWPNLYQVSAQNLGNLYAKQRAYAEARKAYAKAIEAVEAMRSSAGSSDDKAHYSRENEALYGYQVNCCLQVADTDAAFEYAVAGKGRAFLDMLASSPFEIQNPDAPLQALLNEVNNIQARLKHLRGLATGEVAPIQQEAGVPQSVDDASMWAEVAELQSREASIWKQIRYEYPQYFSTQFTLPLSAQQARKIATELDATLLEFHIDVEGWGVFVIAPDQDIQHIRLADKDPLWMIWWERMFVSSQ